MWSLDSRDFEVVDPGQVTGPRPVGIDHQPDHPVPRRRRRVDIVAEGLPAEGRSERHQSEGGSDTAICDPEGRASRDP